MNRLGYIAKNPKRSIGALGTLLAAAGLTVGSGAYFQDTSSSNANAATAGKLDIVVYGSTSPTFDATATVPSAIGTTVADGGATQGAAFSISKLVPTVADGTKAITRSFRVKNDGDVPASLRLDVVNTNDADGLDEATKVVITKGSTTVLPETTWADAATAATNVPIDLTGAERVALEPGASFTYDVKVWLPESGTDQSALMSKTFSTELKVIARSVGGTGA